VRCTHWVNGSNRDAIDGTRVHSGLPWNFFGRLTS
jgi:hypothetical protein